MSPFLAIVFLHYVLNDWFHNTWRERIAGGDTIIVRYADEFVVGFQHEGDAKRFLRDLGERLARFGLELHPGKTRLIEFGRFAMTWAGQAGEVRLPWRDALLRPVEEGPVQGWSQAVPETGQPHLAADQGEASRKVARQPA